MHALVRHAGLLSCVALAPLAACKAVYAPNLANVPLLRQRGELRASADVHDLELAYAITEHVGVQANGYHRQDDNDPKPDEERQHGRGDFAELGIGWMTRVHHDWLQLEVYAGFGTGKVTQDITPAGGTTRHFDARLDRAFVMPTLGVTRTYFDVAVSARVAGVHYRDLEDRGYTSREQLAGDGFADLDQRTWLFLEPCVTVRAGYKWIKLQLQAGRSFKLSSADLAHDPGMLSFGVNVDLFRAFE
jgi:hypothetical protein